MWVLLSGARREHATPSLGPLRAASVLRVRSWTLGLKELKNFAFVLHYFFRPLSGGTGQNQLEFDV
jgi:hypothetical protein